MCVRRRGGGGGWGGVDAPKTVLALSAHFCIYLSFVLPVVFSAARSNSGETRKRYLHVTTCSCSNCNPF